MGKDGFSTKKIGSTCHLKMHSVNWNKNIELLSKIDREIIVVIFQERYEEEYGSNVWSKG